MTVARWLNCLCQAVDVCPTTGTIAIGPLPPELPQIHKPGQPAWSFCTSCCADFGFRGGGGGAQAG